MTRRRIALLVPTLVVAALPLLERGWALPVAATFDRGVIPPTNGSICGPAVVAVDSSAARSEACSSSSRYF